MTTIPKLKQLFNQIISDLQAQLKITIPSFGKIYLRALAASQAAFLKLVYLALGKVQKNIFVDTADPVALGGTLERFGLVKIGRNPFPATQGQYAVTVTGVTGGVIQQGMTFKTDDNSRNPGMLFILDNQYILTDTTDEVTLRALTAGVGSRLSIGDTLTATAPMIGVDSQVTVSGEVVIPNDPEDIEDYRQAVIDSYRLMPQGGAPADYRIWGREASGVRQIYPYAASGAPGEINVFVEATPIDSTDGFGTPTTTILNDVANRIEYDPETGEGRRPLGVFAVHTLPVVVNKVAITITAFDGITDEKKVTIQQALEEMISNIRPFISGADVLSERNDNLSTNKIIAGILSAIPGSVFGPVTMTIQEGAGTPYPETNKTFDNGNIPVLQSITYV